MADKWLINARYCIPMDSPRPILPTELEFFKRGTGKGKSCAIYVLCLINDVLAVPVVVIFTKFDAQIVQEYGNLNNVLDNNDRWKTARDNAENTFLQVYLPKVLNTDYPPKTFVRLEGKRNKHSWFSLEIILFNRNE